MSWRFGISSGACTECPILDMLPAIAAGGAVAIEVGTPPRHFDPWQQEQVSQLGERLRSLSLEAVAIHAPFGGVLDLADPNPHHRHAAASAILTAVAAIKRLGGRTVIVHPSDLERNHHDATARLRDCARSLQVLTESCASENVQLAVETPLPHLIGGSPEEFRWLLSQLAPEVGICLDTGHVSLGHAWDTFAALAAGRLVHVHAHDNRGTWDDHLPPGDGHLDWPAIRRSLETARFEGWIMLELSCPADDPQAYFARALANGQALLAPPAP